jgi:hypothetical protein
MTSLYLFVRFLALLPLTFSPHAVRADPKVDQCLSLGTISQIANCLDPFTVGHSSLSQKVICTTDIQGTREHLDHRRRFVPAQLSSQELGDYLGVVQYALNATENGVPCTSEVSPYTLPESLRNFVALRQVGDLCVLAESTLSMELGLTKGFLLLPCEAA